jgi:hypothetical protein
MQFQSMWYLAPVSKIRHSDFIRWFPLLKHSKKSEPSFIESHCERVFVAPRSSCRCETVNVLHIISDFQACNNFRGPDWPFREGTGRKLYPHVYKCHNIWRKELCPIHPFQDSWGDNSKHVCPQGVEPCFVRHIHFFSYIRLYPSMFLIKPPTESGQKSATSRGWMVVRTIDPNMSIGSTGVMTSCRDDELEVWCFLVLFGIRGDFHYIVFCITLMETDLSDGLYSLCFMIFYSCTVISLSRHINRSSRGHLLLLDKGKWIKRAIN